MAVGGGLGLGGVLLVVLFQLLTGGSGGLGAFTFPGDTQVTGTGETAEEMEVRCNAAGALETHDDCFLVKVANELDELWAEQIEGYRPPRLAFFEGGVQTSCGFASSEVGPFYCPPDEEIFIDLGFLTALQERFGATGRVAQAYIMAHETGHHVQTLLGTESTVRRAQERDPASANEYSIALELQADCYAGVWGRLADERGTMSITEQELEQALRAAAAVGDDRIQRATQGRVDPESWTHGSAEQRRSWYLRGFEAGDVQACDTFADR